MEDRPAFLFCAILARCHYYAHAAVGSGIFGEDVGGVVGRAVVDADDFNVPKRLCQRTVKTGAQIFSCVVNRDNNGNLWGQNNNSLYGSE